MGISKANGTWDGTIKTGQGTMKPANGPAIPFSLGTRFEGQPGSRIDRYDDAVWHPIVITDPFRLHEQHTPNMGLLRHDCWSVTRVAIFAFQGARDPRDHLCGVVEFSKQNPARKISGETGNL